MIKEPEFYCPVYEGKITQYDCDEIAVCVKNGQLSDDGIPHLMTKETILARKDRCIKCKKHNNPLLGALPPIIEYDIASLKIEKHRGGFHPLLINKEEKQRLTIRANGAVWFTSYGAQIENEWQYKAIRKIRCKIDASQAEFILAKAKELLNGIKGFGDPLDCDGEQDYISAIDKKGNTQTKLIMEEYHKSVSELYEEIRKAIAIEKLLVFDYEFLRE